MKGLIILSFFLICALHGNSQTCYSVNVAINQLDDCNDVSVESNEINSFQIFPNPANDFLRIKTSGQIIEEIIIYDMMGQEVRRFAALVDTQTINVADIVTGVYTVKIKTSTSISNHNIIIQHD